MAGLSLFGFTPKSLQDVKAELEADFRSRFGESIDLSPQSNFGQIIGVMAERESDLWAQAQAVYAAFTPDGATGVSLDNVAAITGTVREPATPGTVTLTATGTPGTVLPAGRVASVLNIGTRFQTDASATLVAVAAWAPTTVYAVGARRRNGSPQRVYECVVSGTSAASGGPTTTDSMITDGTVGWRYLGDGTAAIDVAATAQETGPLPGNSGTITVIETPVSGWSSVTNVLDAVVGTDEETDAALRLRREDELRGNGRAAVESIRAAVLEVDGVTACTVFENVSDVTDGNGLPPHSIECLVEGGDDQDVRDAIWLNKAAGIQTYGTTTGSITDSQGATHSISFSRPTLVPIYVILNLTVDASTWPSDGATQVKNAVVAWGGAQRTGKDAVAAAIVAQAFKVAGVLDGVALIGTSNPPGSSTTVSINSRQLATYDTGRVTVNTTNGTP